LAISRGRRRKRESATKELADTRADFGYAKCSCGGERIIEARFERELYIIAAFRLACLLHLSGRLILESVTFESVALGVAFAGWHPRSATRIQLSENAIAACRFVRRFEVAGQLSIEINPRKIFPQHPASRIIYDENINFYFTFSACETFDKF